jgi:L-amino acid N-acyltransferase YncA
MTDFAIERYREQDCAELGRMHYELLGDPVRNGYSLATVGPEFMAEAFYRLSLDNPHFHCDVARADGKMAGFHVFTSQAGSLTSFLVRNHPAGLLLAAIRSVLRRPRALLAILRNLRYLGGEQLPFLAGVNGWWIVAGIPPQFRSREFEATIGGSIAHMMMARMEETFREEGVDRWYVVVPPDNIPSTIFVQRCGARHEGTAVAQGKEMRYYIKRMLPADAHGA